MKLSLDLQIPDNEYDDYTRKTIDEEIREVIRKAVRAEIKRHEDRVNDAVRAALESTLRQRIMADARELNIVVTD